MGERRIGGREIILTEFLKDPRKI